VRDRRRLLKQLGVIGTECPQDACIGHVDVGTHARHSMLYCKLGDLPRSLKNMALR
jgi:hypothetical protein